VTALISKVSQVTLDDFGDSVLKSHAGCLTLVPGGRHAVRKPKNTQRRPQEDVLADPVSPAQGPDMTASL
jgi:hypothetical protein